MIFQQFNLVKRSSVLTNVLSGRLGSVSPLQSLIGRFPREDYQRAYANLERVGIPEKVSQRADTLSGGQQQRVAIARALMQEPSLMLADEPVASLDPATSHSVMMYLEEINRQDGITVICNLHFLSLARRYATRVIALKAGRIVFDGLPAEIDETRFREIYGEDAVEVEIH
jgi:phosphonate transport system ATP-binding protein